MPCKSPPTVGHVNIEIHFYAFMVAFYGPDDGLVTLHTFVDVNSILD